MTTKTISYEQMTNGHPVFNLKNAIKDAIDSGAKKLVVEKGVYELDPLYATQRNLCISNHGFNGPKRIAALIENTSDFELDFSGSTLICNGIMTPIVVRNSENICLKNVKLKNPTVPLLQCKVIGHGEDYIDTEVLGNSNNMILLNGAMYAEYPEWLLSELRLNIEFDSTTGEIAYNTGDNTLMREARLSSFEYLDKNHVRIRKFTRVPPIGNVLVFSGFARVGAAIFCEESKNLFFENIDICSCYGMGLLAQLCENVTLRSFNTVREDGLFATAGADATHFVSCIGTVLVENCDFVGQMDDALNIHGMYTRVLDKGDDWVLVREMSFMATGIPLCRRGDTMRALNVDTLLPHAEKTVSDIQIINDECVKIFFCESADDIEIGDDMENITLNADLIFRKNIVRDNRARGMLIATRGKVIIEDCFFHTSGTAIKFEADGKEYFESGGVVDVTIRNNTFDGCMHGDWGEAAVECTPRDKEEEGRYFHGKISIKENTFKDTKRELVIINNTENFEFLNNNLIEENTRVFVSHVGNCDIQEGVQALPYIR